jgi:hypothetical protein
MITQGHWIGLAFARVVVTEIRRLAEKLLLEAVSKK